MSVHALLTDLKSCLMRRDLQWGRRIHAKALQDGNDSRFYVVTALIKMYARCSSMINARAVFDTVQNPSVVFWNALLLGYADNGEGNEALRLFSRMKACGCAPNCVTYVAALKACTSLAVNNEEDCLEQGRKIHSEIGWHLDHHVQCTLVGMYAKCGSMADAQRVFDSIQSPNVVSWTSLLMGYAENEDGIAALDLFSKMKATGCAPNCVTYLAALKACVSLAVTGGDCSRRECLKRGREIHSEIGPHLDRYVQNTLIDMYAKSGCMVEARRVFDSMQKPDVVSWSALLLGYAEDGEGYSALSLFSRMKMHGCVPDTVTYVAALKACIALALNGRKEDCLNQGTKIHSEIGCRLDHHLQSSLIDMYAKCGDMVKASQVFDTIQKPNVVCWNALLLGYAENGEGQVALDLFFKMKASDVCAPTSVSYLAALKSCGLIGSLSLGRKIHSEIPELNSHVAACLVDFYAKFGSMVEAREVFDLDSGERDASTWTALLAGYSRLGDTSSAFELFEAMQDAGVRPDAVTLVCVLLCCSHAGLVEEARMHFEGMPVQYSVRPTVMHYTCMVDVFGRVNQLNEAIEVIRKMPCNPDAVTWSALLDACRKWKNVEIGRMAFQSLVAGSKAGSAHVLMANMFSNVEERQEQILGRTYVRKNESSKNL